MPSLDWIGKSAVLNHHQEVPYHLLKCDKDLSTGDSGTGNLLVQGDNLLALMALLPYYAGKVKCIYIDPPYNTGNENWIYNDAVNSSEIRSWLGKVVGAEAEDLSRHDKWLCMMYPRLSLLRKFLRPDGVIFVSIDDTEFHHLRMLMNEIFGAMNWVCTLIWKRRQTPDSRNLNGVSADHEYVLCYSRRESIRFKGQKKDLTKYKNPDNDPLGPWMSDNLTGLANAQERPNLHYDLIHPTTGHRYPPHPSRGWIYGPERMQQLVSEGKILWPKSIKGRPRLKRFVTDMKSETTGLSTLLEAPANVAGTKELSSILGTKVFAFPKPTGLVSHLVEQVSEKDSLILDSFAGSGTTGHAVCSLNRADGGQRRFILVEMEKTIARTVTATRLSRVLKDTGLGFRYCELARPLFDEHGQIRDGVSFADLAAHVFFSETGEPLPKRPTKDSPLLGVYNGRAIYLLFNGILGDKRPAAGNVLTHAVARSLPRHSDSSGMCVVYGEACRLSSASLNEYGLTFRQVPFELKVE